MVSNGIWWKYHGDYSKIYIYDYIYVYIYINDGILMDIQSGVIKCGNGRSHVNGAMIDYWMKMRDPKLV